MAIKIQLNSKEALDRLIGGDSEIELTLRNNIVQEFAKTHLKSLVNDEVISKSINKVKSDLELQILNEFYDKERVNYYTDKFKLKETVKEKFKIELNTIFSELIRESVNSFREELNKKLTEVSDDMFNRIKNSQYDDIINSKVKMKLKEIVDLMNK